MAMFTGIISAVGRIERVERHKDERRFHIAAALSGLNKGASIACDGVCLTVVEKGKNWFVVQASAETLSRTILSTWEKGRAVNLECALKTGAALDGHLVAGHVDGVGEIVSITQYGESRELKIKVPNALKMFLAEKGSIAVDGVSLTVNGVENATFAITVIPYTWQHTTLKKAKKGGQVNIEVDLLARYVARVLEARS